VCVVCVVGVCVVCVVCGVCVCVRVSVLFTRHQSWRIRSYSYHCFFLSLSFVDDIQFDECAGLQQRCYFLLWLGGGGGRRPGEHHYICNTPLHQLRLAGGRGGIFCHLSYIITHLLEVLLSITASCYYLLSRCAIIFRCRLAEIMQLLQLSRVQALLQSWLSTSALASPCNPVVIVVPWRWDETPDLSYISSAMPGGPQSVLG
jgi:hypothetical protein